MRHYLALVLLGIILSSCGPHRPPLTFCEVRGNANPPYCRCVDPTGKLFSITIQQCDKYIAQSPSEAEKLRLYVIDLEKQVAHCH